MARLALHYTTSPLTLLTFNASASNQSTYECLKLYDELISTTREDGILLNGRKFSHKLYSHKILNAVITADEIDDTEFTFLRNYWNALYQYIAIYSGAAWSDYKQIAPASGVMPVKYIDDIKYLREIEFEFNYLTPES